jgi:Rne/Rng family ribonuclease
VSDGPAADEPTRVLLLNVADDEERRAALLEFGRLSLLWVEREDERSLVGNVYHGRVLHVEPAIGAAFVDIGAERPAFLHADDADSDPFPTEPAEDETADPEESEPRRPARDITELLEKGQSVVVQVLRDAYASKGASVTTHLSFAGRTLVLMPGLGRVGISRRITDQDTRERLRSAIEALPRPGGIGVVARTAAEHARPDEMAAELDELLAVHDAVVAAVPERPAVALLHEAADFVTRALRELGARAPEGSTGPTRVVTDRAESLDLVRRLEDTASLEMIPELHDSGEPLFHAFGIEQEVRDLARTRVPLRGGAHLVIEGTEALWAVDVNSGRFRPGNGLEQTALATDLLAARECARQIRLRDLSGLVMVDFIDCRDPVNRERVETAFRDELAKDPGRLRVAPMSEFMVVEVTRRRMRAGPVLSGTDSCPTCRGRGRLRSPSALALAGIRDARALLARGRSGTVVIRCDPVVREALDARADALQALAERYGVEVRVETAPDAEPEEVAVRWAETDGG